MLKKINKLSILPLIIFAHSSFAQNHQNLPTNVNNNKNMSNTQQPPQKNNPVQEFIQKNDNILFYMEEAIKKNDITHEDYLVVFNRWGDLKKILVEFQKNPKKYKPEYIAELKEQEDLFSDYVKTMYAMLVNQSASLNKLNFRFDVENYNLVIMVPKVTQAVADEFKRSNYLNQSSAKYKEIVDLGFKLVKLTDGKNSVILVTTANK